LVQIIRIDGLGEVMIHAGCLGSAPILILPVTGHGNDFRLCKFRVGAQDLSDFVAVTAG
jgi:hypothetical protein